MPDDDFPFDHLDPARLKRHEQLLALWRDLPPSELLADAFVLLQLVGVRLHLQRERP
jgi:hypothetical protein